jgi:trimethylamine--corrinoid protein Co-methyltransferase
MAVTHAEARLVENRRRLELLSRAEIERIHAATLDVLQEAGVRVHSQHALDVLAEHGAAIDRATTTARIPGDVVERALQTLPRAFTLGGRTPDYDLPLDGRHIYLSTDGCGISVREADGSVRPSRKADVAAGARLAQALPHISSTSAVVAALDCPPATRVLHELDACLRHSEKHSIVVSLKEEREARALIAMAEAVAGGREELRRRPPCTAIICTVSPLHQERYGMDLALTLAEAGIPVSFYPMPIVGATAPVTLAGAAVIGNAETLSATVVVQLACPGAKVIHGGGPTTMNMSSGAYASSAPEAILLRAAQGQMAGFYGMPAWFGSGATTAKEPGVQSGYENTLAMLMAYLCGADITFGTGLLDGSRILCPESMVIDDELFSMTTRLLKGIAVNEETLAVGLIKDVAFNGEYLSRPHTRKHVRELWASRLGETRSFQAWHHAGSPSTVARARQRVDEILDSECEPFPADLGAELDAIIAAAATEAQG